MLLPKVCYRQFIMKPFISGNYLYSFHYIPSFKWFYSISLASDVQAIDEYEKVFLLIIFVFTLSIILNPVS